MTILLNRRQFFKLSRSATGASLAIAGFPFLASCAGEKIDNKLQWASWISLDSNGAISLFCPRSELGQGVFTALSALVAEEMDAAFDDVTIRPAPLEVEFGQQVTEDSDAVREHWLFFRQLGAVARGQLVGAAANLWQVDPVTCSTRNSRINHSTTGRSVTYGEMASSASTLPLPNRIRLKSVAEFTLLGRDLPKKDSHAIVAGEFQYTSDLDVPGMLVATIKHAPMIGGSVRRIDSAAALEVKHVRNVVDLGSAVAIVASDFWSAESGRSKLNVDWSPPLNPPMDADQMRAFLHESVQTPGKRVVNRGGVTLGASGSISQEFFYPFQAHATMEPMVCIADAREEFCEVWAPTQAPWATYFTAREHSSTELGLLRERIYRNLTGSAADTIRVHAVPAGGGFGRRLKQDYVREAVQTSMAVGAPIKLMWSREEDMRNDFYRPASCHRIEAVPGASGGLESWYHRIAGPGIQSDGANFPYDCPNVVIEVSQHEVGVPTGSLRATSHSLNTQSRECFIDEIARLRGYDPLEFRLGMLSHAPKLMRVLETVADAGKYWQQGSVRKGIALHESKGTRVAQLFEVSDTGNQSHRIEKVVCAIDCGFAVNPSGIRAQIEGAVSFGLSFLLRNGITVSNGKIDQSNFDDYPLLRMAQMPTVEVHIIPSDDPPGGVGEPGLPPVVPAYLNALANLNT